MSSPEDVVSDGAVVLEALREQTHLLLGLTIGFSDEDWASPSRLPGWTRSHVAAHLVENAEGLIRVVQGLHEGRRVRMYDSEADRVLAIERGALDDGLTLQIKLDTSAGELLAALRDTVDDDRPVQLRAGLQMPAHDVALSRLNEVVLHSWDLTPDSDDLTLSSEVASALFEFHVGLVGRREDLPPLFLVADEGPTARLGADGETTTVLGPAADLILWLARGVRSPRISGAVNLPVTI